jgi:Cytochrome c7 and related cytochrome c
VFSGAVAVSRLRQFFCALLFVCVCIGATAPHPVQAQSSGGGAVAVDRNFDHGKTSFPLTGAHQRVTCETCHLNAIFKGLPTKCADCHSGAKVGGPMAPGRPTAHIPSGDACTDCHVTTKWKPAKVDHAKVTQTCATCHNERFKLGKTQNHPPTGSSCESCHSTMNWTSVTNLTFDHGQVSAPCATCHDGVRTAGKSVNHPQTSNNCERCHAVGVAFTAIRMNHAETSAPCATCHTGSTAVGKSATHIQTNQPCDFCHKSTATFKLARFDHTGIIDGCASCHNGTKAIGKTPSHIPTNLPCESCHTSTTSFAVVTMNHTGITTGCGSCHDNLKAKGKASYAKHIPTAQSCETCHANTQFIAFGPGTPMNHVGITGGCATCHDNVLALGKASFPSHLQTNLPCESCHKSFASFHFATFNHTGTTTGCAGCHDGTHAVGKSAYATHITTAQPCEFCHTLPITKTNFTAWGPGTPMNHAGITAGCASCHNGTNAGGTSAYATHIPTAQACELCHTLAITKTNFTACGPGSPMNHAGLPATGCASCHDGTMALGKSSFAKHVATSAPCESCHTLAITKTFKAWGPGTPMSHAAVTSGCASCHDGTQALGKSSYAKHVATSQPCETCHTLPVTLTSFTAWGPNSPMNHAGITSGCASCHDGNQALGKASYAKHITTALACETCHSTTNFVAWGPGTPMNHTGITTGCASCHNGTNALGKSSYASHPVTTQPCETCHSNTNFVAWGPNTPMNHTGITTGCATCHNGTIALGKSFYAQHVPTTLSCESCHTLPITKSFTAWGPGTVMNHNGATTGCATCHNDLNALGKASYAGHLVTTAACESCHTLAITKSYTAWGPGTKMTHAGISTGCGSCHNGVTASGQTKYATHISTTLSCEVCHTLPVTKTTFTAWGPNTPMNHTGISGGCATCHNGTNALGKASYAGHITTSLPCESCHTNTNFVAWGPGTPMNHSGITAGCATCHDNIQAKGKAFLPTHVATIQPCETCHKSTISFKISTFNHTGITTGCAKSGCHDGVTTGVVGKTTYPMHIPTTQSCEVCHTNFTAFGPNTPMNHVGITTGCATCHNNYNALGMASYAPHVATTAACESCHTLAITKTNFTAWGPGTPMNHAGLPATGCANCHNGTNALGMSSYAKHIATAAPCESCHTLAITKTNFTAWGPGTPMNHAGLPPTGCASCHNGTNALGKSSYAKHVTTNLPCETCHTLPITMTNFTAWGPNTPMNHSGITSGCASCHNGTNALGTSSYAKHITTVQPCEFCHSATNFVAWGPGTPMNHAGLPATGCATCHDGVKALGKSSYATHPVTNLACEGCHKQAITIVNFQAWGPGAGMDHTGITSGCASCHDGVKALGKSSYPNHVPTTAACESCHKLPVTLTTFAAWGPGTKMNHTGMTTGCATCHNGSLASGVSAYAKHIPTTAPCESCHTLPITKTNFTAWGPGTPMNHTGLPATGCASCHDGNLALGKSSYPSHLSTTAACESCHTLAITKTSFTAWGPGTKMNHTGMTTGCASCHNGTIATGKSAYAKHITTAQPCELCHTLAVTKASFTAWGPNSPMNHAGITTGCASCHNGTLALGKSSYAKHVTTSQPCEACHSPTNFTAWGPGTPMNHTGITTGCASCHNGTLALGKALYAKHVTTTLACEGCHSATNFTAWGPGTPMNHTGITSGCASCHNGNLALGVSSYAKHVPTTQPCELCHSPTNFTAWGPGTPMKHTGLPATGCASCHNGTLALGAASYAKHIPFTVGCEVCHTLAITKTSFTAWGPNSPMNHPGAGGIDPIQGPCLTCHNGTLALGKIKGHPGTTLDCGHCHNQYNNFKNPVKARNTPPTPLTAATVAAAKAAAAATPSAAPSNRIDHSQVLGSCASCHNGSTARGKPPLHVASTNSCDHCHLTRAWTPVRFDHAAALGTCTSCHDGARAKGRSAKHLPTTAACETCHTNRSWVLITARIDHSKLTGTCASCHTAGAAAKTAKPANHFVTAKPCETCHTTTNWRANYRHVSPRYPGNHLAALTCKSCHQANAEPVTWRDPGLAPTCAACHARTFKPQVHPKALAPVPTYYTVNELRDCAGACHVFADPSQRVIRQPRPSYHRVTGPAL